MDSNLGSDTEMLGMRAPDSSVQQLDIYWLLTKCHILGQVMGLPNSVQSVPAHEDLIVSQVRMTLKQEAFLEEVDT